MNILQIAPIERRVPPRFYGGIERVVYELVEGLVKRGHEVTLLASSDSETSAKLHPIIKYPLGDDPSYKQDVKSREYYLTVALAKILQFITDNQFEIVHNHIGWRLLPFWQFVKVPFLSTLHTPLDNPDKDIVFQEANQTPIVSVSNNQQLSRLNLNYIATISNGINLTKYHLSETKKGYLVFLGRMAQEKGAYEAIMIAKALKKPLIMAAAIHEWERSYFNERVLPYIDNEEIRYIGEIDDNQKDNVLGNAEALLNPIQWEEPFGLTCIEAMACGTPVVTLSRGAMAEIIIDGITGIICRDIKEIIERFDEVKNIKSVDCREHVEGKFDSDIMVDKYLSVYRQISGLSE